MTDFSSAITQEQADALLDRKYSLPQACLVSQCTPAMVQNRVSRGLLPMPFEGTGNLRLFSAIDIAKLSLMKQLDRLGVEARPASMLANTCFRLEWDGLKMRNVSDIEKDFVGANVRTPDLLTEGVTFVVNPSKILADVLERLKVLPETRRRGRPRKQAQ